MNFFGGYNIYKEPFTVTWYDKIPLPIRRAIGAVADLLPPVHGINFFGAPRQAAGGALHRQHQPDG